MLHNEHDYPDPFAFKPERFMKDGRLNPNILLSQPLDLVEGGNEYSYSGVMELTQDEM